MALAPPTGARAYAKGTPEERTELHTLILSLTRRRNQERTRGLTKELPPELGENIGNMLPLTKQENVDRVEKNQELLRRRFLENGSLDRVPVDDIFVDMTDSIIYLNSYTTRRRFTNIDFELFFALLKLSPVTHLYLSGNLIDDVTPIMNALPQTVRALWLNYNIIKNTEVIHDNQVGLCKVKIKAGERAPTGVSLEDVTVIYYHDQNVF